MNTMVNGAMLQSFAQACVNHKIILEKKLSNYAELKNPELEWYPVEKYHDLCYMVSDKYDQPDPVFRQIGSEIINIWYQIEGKKVVFNGIDFLEFQTNSTGYRRMVMGPEDGIGHFKLLDIDKSSGLAVIESTTPFNREVEKGVIRGGLSLFDEISFSKVYSKAGSPDLIYVEFH